MGLGTHAACRRRLQRDRPQPKGRAGEGRVVGQVRQVGRGQRAGELVSETELGQDRTRAGQDKGSCPFQKYPRIFVCVAVSVDTHICRAYLVTAVCAPGFVTYMRFVCLGFFSMLSE